MKISNFLILGILTLSTELSGQTSIAGGFGVQLNKYKVAENSSAFEPKNGYANYGLSAACIIEHEVTQIFSVALNIDFQQQKNEYRIFTRNSSSDKIKFQILTIGGNLNLKVYQNYLEKTKNYESLKLGFGINLNNFQNFRLRTDGVWLRSGRVDFDGKELALTSNITFDHQNFKMLFSIANGFKLRYDIEDLIASSSWVTLRFYYNFKL